MINIPSNIVSDLATATASVMSSVSTGVLFFIGVSVTFYIGRELKRFFPKNYG
jgi:hypothetical protein